MPKIVFRQLQNAPSCLKMIYEVFFFFGKFEKADKNEEKLFSEQTFLNVIERNLRVNPQSVKIVSERNLCELFEAL